MKTSFFKIVFALVFFLSPFIVLAGTEHNMSGWAWSSNIGWISFNSTNDHNANTAGIQPSPIDYGVNKDDNGNLTGYAWSSNIGWIQFGNLSGILNGGENAKLNGNNLTGWARALSNGGGWDGWISLSGTTTDNHNYGITLTDTARPFCPSNNCSGDSFAWGSDVIGWADFNGVIAGTAVLNAIPTVTTPKATSITTSTATLGATVTSLGIPAVISARGICYSTSATNTLSLPSTSSAPCVSAQLSQTVPGTYTVAVTGLTAGATYYYRGYATNATGTGYSLKENFGATANAIPTVTTKTPVTNITTTTATGGGTITSNGGAAVTVSGIVWSTGANPTIALSTKTINGGSTVGTPFTGNMTGLTAKTPYHVRAYATNSVGTAYGADVTFTTTATTTIPTVTTKTPVTNITTTTATGGGTITSNGGAALTQSGIVWSTAAIPTTGAPTLSTKTINGGSTVGTPFTGNMTGLTAKTPYHVRAYATNSVGTAYGADVTFTTSDSSGGIITITGTTASQIPGASPCVPGATGIRVSWTPNGATSYNILRSTTSGSGYIQIKNTAGSSSSSYDDLYSDTNPGLIAGTGTTPTYYHYVVQAVNTFGDEVARSNEVSAEAPKACPVVNGVWSISSCPDSCKASTVTETCPAGATCPGLAPTVSCPANRTTCVAGVCSSPTNHLSPCSEGKPSAIEPYSSEWTWTCTKDISISCSENRTPGWVEPH